MAADQAGIATLDGATAVVTGGASGIGKATATALAEAGANIVLADINADRLDSTATELAGLGVRVVPVVCDVGEDDDVEALAAETLDEFGPPDLVMLNAGFSVLGPPDQIPLADWKAQFEVNFFGVVRGVNAFVPGMRARGSGHLVIVASIAGRYAYTYDAGPYIASKHAAYGYAENLALYLRPQGVEVTVVCPGLVATNLGETARFAGIEDPGGWSYFPEYMARAVEPATVGGQILDAVNERRFLVYTHAEDAELIERRAADVDASLQWQIEQMPDPTPPGRSALS